jgi:hypothetical protein
VEKQTVPCSTGGRAGEKTERRVREKSRSPEISKNSFKQLSCFLLALSLTLFHCAERLEREREREGREGESGRGSEQRILYRSNDSNHDRARES